MANGIPVICSPIESYRKVIEHGVTGFFAESESDWAHYLRQLRDPKLRNEIGLRAKASVVEKFSVESIGQQMYDLIGRYYRAKKQEAPRGILSRLAARIPPRLLR
jgi:glycosyltransferase involved in cell wall biosynthesis